MRDESGMNYFYDYYMNIMKKKKRTSLVIDIIIIIIIMNLKINILFLL